MPFIPSRVESMPRSGIREIMDQAWALGEPIVHLEVGQPDFDPPAHVVAAARDTAVSDMRYTPNAGTDGLRQACAAKLRQVNGVPCQPAEIMITAGSTQGLSLALMGFVDPGEEVLVPDPGWPNYAMAVASVNGRVIRYPLRQETGFAPDPEEVEALVTDRTRVLILNSPSNPLGSVIAADTLEALIAIAERHDLWVVSDECYDQIVFEGSAPAWASMDGSSERVIALYSLSKTYAMTGFRVGYVKATQTVIAAMAKLQEVHGLCVNSAAQRAAVAALTGPQESVSEALAIYRHRRDLAVALAREAGFDVLPPAGSFYLWVDLGKFVTDSKRFATDLLDHARVAVAPGLTFGEQGRSTVRLSLAASDAAIIEGIGRLAEFLATPQGRVAGRGD